MYFPFLTAQWKVPGANENLHDAQNQAARDGAVIVNCLWDLYRVAYNRTPSVLEACHFSWLSDLEFAQLWVHWREGAQHYMEHVDDFSLRKEDDVCKARGFLRNIVNSAVTERLDSIKKALPLFAKARTKSYPYPLAHTAETMSLGGSSAATPPFQFDTPRYPQSTASEPSKKRPKLESDSESKSDSGFNE